jgi:hypothetical protein
LVVLEVSVLGNALGAVEHSVVTSVAAQTRAGGRAGVAGEGAPGAHAVDLGGPGRTGEVSGGADPLVPQRGGANSGRDALDVDELVT